MKKIEIKAKEWMDCGQYTNYFSARCYVDGKCVVVLPFQVGSGSEHIASVVEQELRKEVLADIGDAQLSSYCFDKCIELVTDEKRGTRLDAIAFGEVES